MIHQGVLSGLTFIALGIYVLLKARGIIPKNPKDPEKAALWRSKFGGIMTILSPLIIICGILQLANIL